MCDHFHLTMTEDIVIVAWMELYVVAAEFLLLEKMITRAPRKDSAAREPHVGHLESSKAIHVWMSLKLNWRCLRRVQWRLVVKMAGRAAKFHLWLNIHRIVALPLAVYNGVSSHSSSPKLIKLVMFRCPY